MSLCVEHKFDILLTIDKNLLHQQNLEKYHLTIIILNSLTSKVEELKEFVPLFQSQLLYFKKYKAYIVEKEINEPEEP